MTIRRALLATLACFGLWLPAGCSADEAAEQAAESAIEDAASDQGEDVEVDVERDGEEVTIETDEGTIKVGTDELPDGYPADEVPVVDGEIVTSGAIGDAFAVVVKSDASIEDAVKLMEDAGMKTSGGGITGTAAYLTGNGFGAAVQVLPDGSLSYTVSPQ